MQHKKHSPRYSSLKIVIVNVSNNNNNNEYYLRFLKSSKKIDASVKLKCLVSNVLIKKNETKQKGIFQFRICVK